MATGEQGVRRRRSSDRERELARERIRHVVVLMLENRSFDHMLGFLDHPAADYPGLRGASYPNPFDPTDPASAATDASDDAEFVLPLDPPHGHLSAKKQMNGRGWRRFRMDGFVAAYAEKLSGREPVPYVHFGRIQLTLFVVTFFVAAALVDLFDGGGLRLAAAVVAAVALVALVVRGMHLPRVLQRPWRSFVRPVLAGGAALGATAAGALRLATHGGRGVLWWWLPSAALTVPWVLQQRAAVRRRNRARVDEAGLQEAAARVMRCMPPDRIPVLATLARQFAVCAAWFSSVPGATWPNRNFAHAATSEETVDIEIGLYDAPTVFEQIEEEGASWRIYHDGMAQVMAFHRLWDDTRAGNWFGMPRFFDDVAHDRLPNYAFIEPSHGGPASNSQHPGNNQRRSGGATDFERGERLMRDIYEALRARPDVFEKTLFLITYDEHGGLFDHVPPPRARHPDLLKYVRRQRDTHATRRGEPTGRFELTRRIVAFFVETPKAPFDFRCLGPRVPAVVVSPWIVPATIDRTRYDHSSIAATVRELFAPTQPPLTRRDKAANSLLHLVAEAPAAREMPPLPEVAVPAAPLIPTAPPPPPPVVQVTVASPLEEQLAVLRPLTPDSL